ncbi:MAG: Arc family DNA-binding protein [Cypionkella sp.]
MNPTMPALAIRPPQELKDRLRESAKASRRSMNSQIIVLLERALEAETARTGEVA